MAQKQEAPFGHARIFTDDGNAFDVILNMPWNQMLEFYLHNGLISFQGGCVERAHMVRFHQITVVGDIPDPASAGVGQPPSMN